MSRDALKVTFYIYISEMRCPECGGLLILEDEEYYCSECGLVLENLNLVPSPEMVENRDVTPNWRRGLKQTEKQSLNFGTRNSGRRK